MQPSLTCGFLVGVSVVGVHLEAVGDGAEVMKQLVDMDPFRFFAGLDLMADYAWPHGAVEKNQLGAGILEFLAELFKSVSEPLPALVFVRAQQRMGNAWNQKGFYNAHCPASGIQLATTFPVPMTVP
jgi:hypothetical protein